LTVKLNVQKLYGNETNKGNGKLHPKKTSRCHSLPLKNLPDTNGLDYAKKVQLMLNHGNSDRGGSEGVSVCVCARTMARYTRHLAYVRACWTTISFEYTHTPHKLMTWMKRKQL